MTLVKNPLLSQVDDREWVRKIDQFLRAQSARTSLPHMDSETTRRMNFAECANLSDGLIADISSVAVDYLATEKPIGLNSNYASSEEFYRAKPFAKGVYAIERDLSNLDSVLDSMTRDPDKAKREKLRKLYLGNRAPDQQVTYFTEKMRELILRGRELGVD
jgi:CDP-glycerol glycerophosphotransferase (TagB/SpsB family)